MAADATRTAVPLADHGHAPPTADPPTAGPPTADRPVTASPPHRTVEFLGVPVAAYAAMQEWNDAVFRECELIAALGPGQCDLPPRLVDLAALLSGRFALEMEGLRDSVDAARARGETVVDLHRIGPDPAAPALAAAESFLAMMEELDGFCRTDAVLTAPPEPVVVRLRRWFVTELRAQLVESAAPRPFPEAP